MDMCGRYAESKNVDELEHYYERQMQPQFRARFEGNDYNVAPTRQCPVVTVSGIELMRWGLVPAWAKSTNTGYSMHNAVGETLLEKNTYRGLIKNHRCLVPATGYFEWLDAPEGKIPYYYFLPERELFSFAGLWTSKLDVEGQELRSFTIITSKPNELAAKVHDRMPAILSKDEESVWLDTTITEGADLIPILDPYPAEEMAAYPVSKAVGSVKNNSADLVKPV